MVVCLDRGTLISTSKYAVLMRGIPRKAPLILGTPIHHGFSRAETYAYMPTFAAGWTLDGLGHIVDPPLDSHYVAILWAFPVERRMLAVEIAGFSITFPQIRTEPYGAPSWKAKNLYRALF